MEARSHHAGDPPDRPIWDEYGLKESEAARYENGDENFTVTGYRLQDTTGAMAAFDWQRPAEIHRVHAGPAGGRHRGRTAGGPRQLPAFVQRPTSPRPPN